MSSGCFVVLLLDTCPFVLQVLSTPFVHFLMGLIVCAAVIKMEMRHKILSTFSRQQVRYYPYLETLTLFVSTRTAVSLGGLRANKKG